MSKYARYLVGLLALASLSTACFADSLTPGNLVVYRAGDGANRLLFDNAVPLFLDEYTQGGILVQSLAMPTDYGPSPMTHPLTSSGTSGVGGLLSRSQDGTCLIVPGYAALVGTESLINSSPTNIPRVIGVVWADGSIDTRTALTDLSNYEPRGVTSTDGYHLWTASGGAKGTPRYTTLGSSSSISVCTNTKLLRGINIYDGNLYACLGGGGVYQIGSGLPTTGSNSFELLVGTEGASDMQCIFADLDSSVEPDTLYSVEYSGSKLSKYSNVGGTWTLTGSITGSYWRLTGQQDGTTVRIFAIRGTTNLVSIVDTAGYNAGFSSTTAVLLATAPSNTTFRGVALSPGPWTSTPAPPTILVQPTNQFIALGSNAAFRVVASGYPLPQYQWRRNGVNISGETNNVMNIANVQLSDDSARYSVKAWNDLGYAISDQVNLSVLYQYSFCNDTVLPVSDPTEIVQGYGKSNLVLITHGWNADTDWMTTMSRNISDKVSDDWQVAPLYWVNDANTLDADRAYDNGKNIGARLGKILAKQTWRHIHLIAHSAGGALIEKAAEVIKSSASPPDIHETFLDPYCRSDSDGKYKFGKNADWADCYFTENDTDTRRFTDGQLAYAHNVEISWLDPNRIVSSVIIPNYPAYYLSTRIDHVRSSHSWPRDFYGSEPSRPCLGDYGFPLSKESGGWANRGNYPNMPATTKKCAEEPIILQRSTPQNLVEHLEIESVPSAYSTGGITIDGQALTITATSPFQQRQLPTSDNAPSVSSGTESLPWIAFGITVTSHVNYVAFDAEFSSTNVEPSLLTIYWNTNLIGVIDESVELAGYHPYHFALPATYNQGAFTLGFELNAISNTTSSVSVTNVVLGYQGVDVPIVLDTYLSPSNNMPVLELAGASNFVYYIDGSTNLQDWLPYAVLVNTNTTTSFEIPDSTNYNQMFYRGRLK